MQQNFAQPEEALLATHGTASSVVYQVHIKMQLLKFSNYMWLENGISFISFKLKNTPFIISTVCLDYAWNASFQLLIDLAATFTKVTDLQ